MKREPFKDDGGKWLIPVLPKVNSMYGMLSCIAGYGVNDYDPVHKMTMQELENEFKLIAMKKSKLSASQRAYITRKFVQTAGIEYSLKLINEIKD